MTDHYSSNGGYSFGRRFRDGIVHLLHFVKNPFRMGAPLPSSQRIAKTIEAEMMAHGGVRRVVELGAGMGTLTGSILNVLPPDGQLLCIEREKIFCRNLEERFNERVKIVQGDAYDLQSLIAGTLWENPDAIVCSVPLMNEPGYRLVRAIRGALPPGGLYLQVANLPAPIHAYFDVHKSYVFLLSSGGMEKLHCAVVKDAEPQPTAV